MAWQPDPEQVKQLAGFLRDSLNAKDLNAQKYATMMLQQARGSPDYANYLTYILSSQSPSELGLDQAQTDTARGSAAISLKNIVKQRFRHIQPQSQAFIQSAVMVSLQDPSSLIRAYAGNIITEIVMALGIFGWPDVLPQLVTLAANEKGDTKPQVSEAAAGALVKLCEDNVGQFNVTHQNGSRALDYLFPQLINLTASPTARVRACSLEAINIFLPGRKDAVVKSLDKLSPQLFKLALDDSSDVRRFVCRAFVQMLEVDPQRLLPEIKDLVTYMVSQQKSEDPQVALEAAEFWLAFGEQHQYVGHLGPYLQPIIEVLLESMVYSEDDQMRHEQERDDAEEEDKAEDIKPQFAKSKASKGSEARKDANGSNGAATDDLSEGEIEDDLDEDGGDPEDEWTLRKCSAAALDVLATKFHGPVFEICLPWLRANFVNPQWPKREAAVLAIGAISEGCMMAVTPHLPELVPFLINLLGDSEPVVRKITCWTLGRYSKWAAYLPDDAKNLFYVPMMDGLLKRMLDGNKSVQEAAASAFSSLEEASGKQLLPYSQVILQQFQKCFQVYKDKNMYILYDCVQTLAENLGADLARPELLFDLMAPLMDRFSKVDDESRELFPLLECLSYVAPALGSHFQQYAEVCYTRCIKLLHANLEQELAAKNAPWERPDKDFRVTTLDLLSSIIQALQPEVTEALIARTQPALIPLLMVTLQDEENDVKQSAFALLGDMAKFAYPRVKQYLSEVMPILVTQLDADNTPDDIVDDSFAVINNACWSCGEIALIEKENMAPYLKDLYKRFEAIITNPAIWPHVQENACIALGRLGIWHAAALAPSLQEFGENFVTIMKLVENTEEKHQAFLGLNRVILQNPKAFEAGLPEYFVAAAHFAHQKFYGDEELKQSFREVLQRYKQEIPDFDGFLQRLPKKEQTWLYEAFQN